MTPLSHPAADPRPESSVTLRQTHVSVWHQQGCRMSVRQENLDSECFLCLPEFRPKILEAGGTFGLLLWGRVLVFQNSYSTNPRAVS